jgi:5-methylcytosine-specific restriction endonuclease McrA
MPYKDIEIRKAYLKDYHKKYSLKNKKKLQEKKRLYVLNNKDKIKESSRLYYLKNLERIKLYRLKNKKKMKKYFVKYNLNNRNLLTALEAKRRAIKLRATPKFANLKKIREIYKNCPKGYHVDHIVPLNNKNVCGLHVEWNLQYLTASANLSKSNKLIY